jgi:hypothetical protein
VMPRLARYALVLMLALPVMGGCAVDRVGAPAEGSGAVTGTLISASVQVPAASPGAVVSVRFTNQAPHLFAVNTCLRQVERRDGATWVLLPEELRLCLARLDLVPALSALTASADVPGDAVPGEYRFRFSMAPPTGPAVEITTPAFRVE